jgi:hypothetical protein
MCFLPKWSLPYRLNANTDPWHQSGIFSKRINKKKVTKQFGFWYVLHKLIVFQNFFFLVNLLIWLIKFIVF